MAQPIKKLKSGRVEGAVWEKEFDGKKSYSFTFQKSYKDKEGKWQNTNFFTQNELADVINLAQAFFGKKVRVVELDGGKAKAETTEEKPEEPEFDEDGIPY